MEELDPSGAGATRERRPAFRFSSEGRNSTKVLVAPSPYNQLPGTVDADT